MLRTAFIGSRNAFDQLLVHWLAQRSEMTGVVWTQSTAWRRTWRGRLRFAARRARRRGPLKALDEAAFHLWYHRFAHAADAADLDREVLAPYRRDHRSFQWRGDALMTTGDLNGPEVRAFLAERRPDVVFAVCISDVLGPELLAIPRHGVLLWHEGLTPEYRGLYSPFWAVHELDFDRIGATLLRVNDVIDGGAPFVRERAQGVDPWHHGHLYMGHKAIVDTLPAVERLLVELEAGTARPLARDGAVSGYYSYPGITDLVRQRWRLRRTASRQKSLHPR